MRKKYFPFALYNSKSVLSRVTGRAYTRGAGGGPPLPLAKSFDRGVGAPTFDSKVGSGRGKLLDPPSRRATPQPLPCTPHTLAGPSNLEGRPSRGEPSPEGSTQEIREGPSSLEGPRGHAATYVRIRSPTCTPHTRLRGDLRLDPPPHTSMGGPSPFEGPPQDCSEVQNVVCSESWPLGPVRGPLHRGPQR